MRIPTTLILLLLSSLLPTTLAARTSATSFCKCVCFNNSTIIALNPPDTSSRHASLKFSRSMPAVLPARRDDANADDNKKDSAHHHKPTCSDCNRAFCLNQGLKICQNAKEEDVFATCFQRDSLKDELVVILFVACTGGLLLWAVIKPWLQKARDKSYAPLSFGGRGSGAGTTPAGAGVDAAASASSRRRAGPGVGVGRFAAAEDDEDDGEEQDHTALQSQSQSQSRSRQ